jgi:hypothetical protein
MRSCWGNGHLHEIIEQFFSLNNEAEARNIFKFLVTEGIGQDSKYFYTSYAEFELRRKY